MHSSEGVSLYLQVDTALKEFQTGVARLKEQQARTDSLLAQGNHALENLVRQIAGLEEMKKQAEEKLSLLEACRQSIGAEMAGFRTQLQARLEEQEQMYRNALSSLKADCSLRRQELLGLVQELQGQARRWSAESARLDAVCRETAQRLQNAELQGQELELRLAAAEKRSKYLLAAAAGAALLALAALLL